jgi:hypothetical protein
MTDLERVPALDEAPYGALFRALQRWMWMGQGSTTYAHYRQMCAYLAARGHAFMTTSALYHEVTEAAAEHAGARAAALDPETA